MAKELPYFQFEPAAYLTGDITICSLEAQGLYLNICCVYWQKNCNVTYQRLSKRYSQAKDSLDELIEEEIIKHDADSDRITINFLDEQWDALEQRRKINSANGRKGGLAKAKANAKHIEENRKEENRKEDKRIDNNISSQKGLHLFSNSPYFDIQEFKAKFEGTDYEAADLDYYYEALRSWSESKGVKKKDWIATARTFMLRDRKENKLITKKDNNGLSQTTIDILNW